MAYKLLESDVETYVAYLTQEERLDRGLLFSGKIRRQVPIKGYGILDLIAIEKSYRYYGDKLYPYLTFTVIELKRDTVDINTYYQALKYCYGIKEYLENRRFYAFDFSVILIGKKVLNGTNLEHLKYLTSNPNRFGAGCVKNLTTYEYFERGDKINFHFC